MAEKPKTVVIVGGVAGGASAAARLRRLDETANIIILERTGYVSYANCGLPYYIGGAIKDRDRLTLQTPQSFRERFNVDVRVNSEAASIDRAAKSVHVRDLKGGGEYDLSYDALILSPGARAVKPRIPGIDGERIFTLRNVENTFAIDDFIRDARPASAVVVGAGFIGMEMAENLVKRGLKVTVVDKLDHVMPTLDADMAALVQNQMYDEGVLFRKSAGVTGFAAREGGVEVDLDDGYAPLEADMAILAIGVEPESDLAAACGLELGVRGAIKVDDRMRTNDPAIYAVGDAVQVKNRITGEDVAIPLAGPANKQGRIAADNICGIESTYKGSIGSSVMKFFNLTIASCGLTTRAAEQAGIDFDFVITNPTQHATYYPGAQYFMLKVLYERGTKRIIGAQAVGPDGVDKRMDVLAVAIAQGMTADDLVDLELCYAPPYGAAKDPVNMIGYVIQNIMDGLVETAPWSVVENPPENSMLVDVRSKKEFSQDHLDGAVNIDVDGMREKLPDLDPSVTYHIYCQVGIRGYIATRILTQNGFKAKNLQGGYSFYNAVDYASWRKEATSACGMPV
ncbi:FAD-dependent oxidoreductase [Curtanaerobium respiraculi]|uniref:FAD-dependent oxidoreductase n=1 Tax=Curtanaerobium respiraculi TaxID=2949669 RepID=UPI0024B3A4E9|nr:FAD-dependent oxidoreductase [Curtanaerobium respiraculi]